MRVLPADKEDWPCPTCKRIIRDHSDFEIGRCHIVALLNCVLGKGPGWAVGGIEAGREHTSGAVENEAAR